MFEKIKIEQEGVFFISDFHLGHHNVIRFDKRPFNNLMEMHDALLKNWNEVVGDEDIVFYLGDLFYRSGNAFPTKFVHQLKGKIHFIMGNHDRYRVISKMNRFETISSEVKLTVKDHYFHLHHHPILSWDRSYHGSIHLHGHCHQNMARDPNYEWFYKKKVMDVGCNGINYTPISYAEVIARLESKN